MSPIRTEVEAGSVNGHRAVRPLAARHREVELILVPAESMFPATCAELALEAAALASASTCVAGFVASPFPFAALLPQPARSTAARTRARTEARIVPPSLSNTIAGGWRRRARYITSVSRSRTWTARSQRTSASSAPASSTGRASRSRESRLRRSGSERAGSSSWARSGKTRPSAGSSPTAARACTTSPTRSRTFALRSRISRMRVRS